jgi:hypothetical protein
MQVKAQKVYFQCDFACICAFCSCTFKVGSLVYERARCPRRYNTPLREGTQIPQCEDALRIPFARTRVP